MRRQDTVYHGAMNRRQAFTPFVLLLSACAASAGTPSPTPGGVAQIASGDCQRLGSGEWAAITPEDAPAASETGQSVHWTGAALIVWDARRSAAYDPCSDRWRTIAQPPDEAVFQLETREDPLATPRPVAAGQRLLFWGHARGKGAPAGDARTVALVYEPALDRWRPMSAAGMPSPRMGMARVWTGRELLVWGGYGIQAGDQAIRQDGALYDPSADRWRPMAPVPAPLEFRVQRLPGRPGNVAFAWTGSELVVHDGRLGFRYDPGSDRWAALPRPPGARDRVQASVAWSSGRVVLHGGALENTGREITDGALFDPAAGTWTRTPPLGRAPYFVGDRLLAAEGQGWVSYDPGTNQTARLDPRAWPAGFAPIIDGSGGARYLLSSGPRSAGVPETPSLRVVELEGGRVIELPPLAQGRAVQPRNLQLHGDVVVHWGDRILTAGGMKGCEDVPPDTGCDPVVGVVARVVSEGAILRLR